jgi:hypothetical protein
LDIQLLQNGVEELTPDLFAARPDKKMLDEQNKKLLSENKKLKDKLGSLPEMAPP